MPKRSPWPLGAPGGPGDLRLRNRAISSTPPKRPRASDTPARWVSPRPPGRPSWGLWGRAGLGIGRAIRFSAGGGGNHAISQPEVAGPSWSSQRPRRKLPHTPMASSMRWPLGATARRRRWRWRRPKRPSQIFLVGRRAALDCCPPL